MRQPLMASFQGEMAYFMSNILSQSSVRWQRDLAHFFLSTLMNRLIEQGFVIQHVSDSTDMHPDPSAEPGTWDHFVAYVPPWLDIWATYRPVGGVA